MNPIQFPLISILLPVLNAEKYLAECLESIKTQTYKTILRYESSGYFSIVS